MAELATFFKKNAIHSVTRYSVRKLLSLVAMGNTGQWETCCLAWQIALE